MATHNTADSGHLSTQGAYSGHEVGTLRLQGGGKLATAAYHSTGSVPSGLPETPAIEGAGVYVFRIGHQLPIVDHVTITIDTNQVVEQARIRKINQAIRRAGKG